MSKSEADTQPHSPSPTATNATSKKRSAWGTLFGHQESGLALVILLIGIGLTVYGIFNPVESSQPIDRPADSQVVLLDLKGVEHEHGTIARTKIATYRVISEEGTQDYPASSITKYDSESDTLYARKSINPFLNTSNLVLVLKDASFFAIIAVGMTGVIILAGIDLSVGSIYGLSAIIGAMALQSMPGDMGWFLTVPIAVLICVLVGAICGFANGSMSVGLRVHPFVITLGMMAILRGLTVVIPQELFGQQSIGGFPDSFTNGFFKAEFYGVHPVPVILMILCGVAGWFVLSKTVFGRRIFAIGGNETAAEYAGIPVGRVKILVYTITGALCGMSAAAYLGYYGAAETNAGNAYELQVIAATVIGGASLMGGRGTIIGAVLGAIIIQLINNTLIIFKVDTSYNQIVMGAAIIVAVVIDQAKQRIQARRA
ncbi:MAG: ABC transporter permease [Phycisphaerales bacterium]